ncbi:uncharacterized protein LOC119678853 isoform X2 [Teleopsis dalmanni]|uniref:uncharacterized protein LOC119678853 isoform X2 n=1 Tax=Teleopsis dalmanni TaxID=139649 RepID=UPI0018CCDD6E|nr:uncharacterized protein LOC119678853 isoform X2 [Teleopsis dalmanni]
MHTNTQAQPTTTASRRVPSHPIYLNDALSPKKTALIIVTVIGCIAILWPKVFYPMMFGGTAIKPNIKDQRGPGGCCDVVLDREKFLNTTPAEPFGPQLYRKQINIITGEVSLRQERPAHLHPESIYQAMRERGRAIPVTPTVPIVERKGSPSNPPPRIVEGRPGPIPGMRPPMGAGSMHQPQKGNSMGFIMPIYTIAIIVFFGYTIMKIVLKKPIPNAPYGPAPSDPNFRKEVFGHDNGRHVEDLNGSKLGWREHQTRTNLHSHDPRSGSELYHAASNLTAAASNLSSSLKYRHSQHQQYSPQYNRFQPQHQQIEPANTTAGAIPAGFNKESEQLMEIEKLRKRLEDTEKAMARLIAEMNSDQIEAKKLNENSNTKNGNISNGHTLSEHIEEKSATMVSDEKVEKSKNDEANPTTAELLKDGKDNQQRKRRDGSVERTVAVLGMELTASCEGGQKWTGRPPTPVFFSHNEHSKEDVDIMPEPQSIYLEGSLAHESQILVADSETKTTEVYDEELNGSPEEPAVVLSSKMTLSLINLDALQKNETKDDKNDIESPLADDIEIIGHDEN